MFLLSIDPRFNNHYIFSELKLLSDHALLYIIIGIINKDINISQRTIPRNNNKEADFVSRYANDID